MQSKTLFSAGSAAHNLPTSIFHHFSITDINEYYVLKPFLIPNSTLVKKLSI